ncbi:uncharacterized protein LOC113296284 [Papaver somniferum]|uniref:uncharacterized protein LOC113296284 n=1 Tax=Papaver somniferum TaxID=3469 RepID=UPI000E6FBC92|nr:uncharacterized protein LOC113296284 [Papaver somniferum]
MSSSVSKYLMEIKSFQDQLAAAGSQISDTEMVVTILSGLPLEYHSFATSIRIRNPLVSSKELFNLLMNEEIVVTNTKTDSEAKAFAAQHYQQFKLNSSYNLDLHTQTQTQFFIEVDQKVEVVDIQILISSQDLPMEEAMLAAADIFDDSPWYADSGANNHITSNDANLTTSSPYEGAEMISTASGQGLDLSEDPFARAT